MTKDPAAVREVARIRAAYARRARSGRDARYSPFEPAHLFQMQSLERALLRALRDQGIGTLSNRRVLDLGCGEGSWLAGLVRYGAELENLVGLDLRPDALPRRREAPNVLAASSDSLPFVSASFDMVCQLTMFSSVLDVAMRRRMAAEMTRVLRPGGIILWYDFTVNPMNRDVAGVGLAELRTLFQRSTIRARRVTLAPPLARLVAPWSFAVASAIELVPWTRTHLLATITPHSLP